MSDEAVYLLGYYARVQTMIELLAQFRLRPLKDVREGLGPAYFDQMSDATRKRWLKAIATSEADATVGSRLESVYAEVAEVRNHISHAPMNIHHNGGENPDDIRVGSARWMNKPLPSSVDIIRAQARLEWIESWIVWLIAQQKSVVPHVRGKDDWRTFEPERPSATPPTP